MNLYDGLIWDAIGGGSGGGGGGGDSGTAVFGKDVNLYDYDGTLLHSYSKSEFLALSSLPSNPNRNDRLVAKGWNWSLADAKDYVRDYGILDIGQMYDTASGETEMDIELQPLAKHPYLKMYVNGTATIKWGDGTQSTLTGTSLVIGQQSIDHEYASAGEYTISISGEVKPYYVSNTVPWYSDGTTKNGGYQNKNVVYTGGVSRLFMSKDFHISSQFLSGFVGLREVTLSPQSTETMMGRFLFSDSADKVSCFVIPTCITSLSYYAVQSDRLRVVCYPKNATISQITQGTIAKKTYRICLPPSVTQLYSSDFGAGNEARRIVYPNSITSGANAYNCYYLTEVTYPSSMTSAPCSNYGCYSLYKIVFPSTCTTITGKVNNEYSLKEIHVKATTPPTLNEADAFTNLAADAKIYVPSASLAAYQAAANWSTFADKMIGE